MAGGAKINVLSQIATSVLRSLGGKQCINMYAHLAHGDNTYFEFDGVAWSGSGITPARIPMPSAGRVEGLFVKCSFNADTQDSVFTVMKNGVDTTMTVTVTAGSTTQVSDTTHVVTFAVGDDIVIHRPASGGASDIDANVTMVYRWSN